MKKIIIFIIFLILTGSVTGQSTKLVVDISDTKAEIAPTMYGIFYEDINFAGDGGLYAELVKNRGFEFELPKMGWSEPNTSNFSVNRNSGAAEVVKTEHSSYNRNVLRLVIHNCENYVLMNEGFRGMGLKKDAKYNLTFLASKQSGDIKKMTFAFVNDDDKVLGSAIVEINNDEWSDYSASLTSSETIEKAKLKITFEGNGVIDLDQVSIFPEDTWNGRKNGLRKDLVQLLYDIEPGFLRFPGGCIVEGRTLAKRYQWKKTVCPVEERKVMVNRWNTEFGHRLTPDYFQSFGLGFYEYFLLSEDLGAEPLPIINCGMACQFNTGELVPLDELDPYVKDALDLIEFANGDVNTDWGKVRADMGHPEPFNLTYIGIGNEQWGIEYMERYVIFEKAIREKYPDVVIVAAVGPYPDGELFEYGMEKMKEYKADIVDEHYYKPPEWFRKNAARYDSYDRNGPKVFAGEYAAQSVAIASPENKNNWECALSEAAFMTGLERNADVVTMTSYAPLFAHVDAWQWTPDLIWFDNLESYGTPNYYVQKMFSTHRGTDLLSITFEDGNDVTGQDGLYSSAVKDTEAGKLFIKLVNTTDKAQAVNIELENQDVKEKASVLTLTSDKLEDVNSIEEPMKISPKESELIINDDVVETSIDPNTFIILEIDLDK